MGKGEEEEVRGGREKVRKDLQCEYEEEEEREEEGEEETRRVREGNVEELRNGDQEKEKVKYSVQCEWNRENEE